MKRSSAEILREYGPFPGRRAACMASAIDGRHVWFASGDKLNALDPASGEIAALDRCRRACGNGLRRPAPVPDRRGPHPEDRSRDRPGARHDPGARRRRRFRARLGRRHALGRAVSRPQDPSDRSRDRSDPAHHRIQPLRHRRHLGRRRALARHLGRRRERPAAHRSRRPARCWSSSTCRRASACRASNPTAATASSAAAASSGKVRAVRRPRRG